MSNPNKSIIRTLKNRENPYVMMDKWFLSDKTLSWKAKGLLSYFLSKPDDWRIMVEDVVNKSKDGKDSVYSGLKELKNRRYLLEEPIRDEKGKILYWEKRIYERPVDPLTENPEMDNPYLDKPDFGLSDTENPHLLNNELTKNDINKKMDGGMDRATQPQSPDPILITLIENVPMLHKLPHESNEFYTEEIYTMLKRQFPNELEPEIIVDACVTYNRKRKELSLGGNDTYLRINSLAGLFCRCYEEALNRYRVRKFYHQILTKAVTD